MCKLPPPRKVAAGDKARIRGAPGGTTLGAQRGVNPPEKKRMIRRTWTCRAPLNGVGRKVAGKEQRKVATVNKDRETLASSGRLSRVTCTHIV